MGEKPLVIRFDKWLFLLESMIKRLYNKNTNKRSY